MNDRFPALLICFLIALRTSTVFGTDLRHVLAHPEKYEAHEVDLVGIARVPGYFYLFADIEAAAKTDLSKALLIRQNSFAEKEYREADRQWVRVTGVISSKARRGWDPGPGVLLRRAQIQRDRPPPRIKNPTVLGIFQNATAKPLAIELVSQSEGGQTFFLSPHEADKTIIWEGQLVVSQLEGPTNLRLDRQKIGKPIASRTITFRNLPADYQYSPEWSDKRTLYFRIFSNRIESVPASQARDWKLVGSKSGLW